MVPANEERLHEVLIGQARVLAEAHGILAESERRDRLAAALLLGSRARGLNRIDDAEEDRLMDLLRIRALCYTHRMRFLEASQFRGQLPDQAVHALRRLEKRTGRAMRGFRILAPAGCFRKDMRSGACWLLVPLGEQQFYIVHAWGARRSWQRAVAYWPLRGVRHLLAVSFSIGAIGGACYALAATGGVDALRAVVLSGLIGAAAASIGWFAFRGRFNGEGWNGRRLF